MRRCEPIQSGSVWGPGRLGDRIARRAEHADEQFRLANLAGLAIDDWHPLAGIVHEGLVASGVLLAHRRRQALLEAAEQFAEAAVAVSVGMDAAIFLPEHKKRHARLLQFDGELGPIRLLASPLALLDPGAGEQPMLERLIGQFARQWPGQARQRRPLQVILHGAARNTKHHRNLAAAFPLPPSRSICRNCLMVSLLFAGIKISSCTRRLDAKVADPGGIVRAENRPVIDWNRGRLQLGTVAGY